MKLSFHICSVLILKYIILISAVAASCTSCANSNVASAVNNVSSWHHQSMSAVDESCLKVTGTTLTNGFDFIEAIERTDRNLAIGLQFHPEVSIAKHVNKSPNESSYMDYTQAQSIFRNFVNKSCAL